MKFVCSERHFNVLDDAAIALGMEAPGTMTFVDLTDDRLIGIARLLGMEQLVTNADLAKGVYLPTVESTVTEEPGDGIQINRDMPPAIRKNGGVNVTIEPVITDPEKVDELAAEVAAGLADKPVYGHCVICNAPIYEKRHTTCSKKCLQEKARRYAKEYARKHVKTEGVSGEGDPFDDSFVSPEPVSIGRDLDESEEAGVVTERPLATASNPA